MQLTRFTPAKPHTFRFGAAIKMLYVDENPFNQTFFHNHLYLHGQPDDVFKRIHEPGADLDLEKIMAASDVELTEVGSANEALEALIEADFKQQPFNVLVTQDEIPADAKLTLKVGHEITGGSISKPQIYKKVVPTDSNPGSGLKLLQEAHKFSPTLVKIITGSTPPTEMELQAVNGHFIQRSSIKTLVGDVLSIARKALTP